MPCEVVAHHLVLGRRAGRAYHGVGEVQVGVLPTAEHGLRVAYLELVGQHGTAFLVALSQEMGAKASANAILPQPTGPHNIMAWGSRFSATIRHKRRFVAS